MYLQDTSSSISIAQRQIAFVSNFNTTLTGSSSLNFALICLPWEWKNVHTVKIFLSSILSMFCLSSVWNWLAHVLRVAKQKRENINKYKGKLYSISKKNQREYKYTNFLWGLLTKNAFRKISHLHLGFFTALLYLLRVQSLLNVCPASPTSYIFWRQQHFVGA